jgi:SAM-dependent methyltransferase
MDRFRNTGQPDWDWWGRLWPAPGETLRDLGLETDDAVVEIGSGNGYLTVPAARIVDPAPVYALDIDASLLAELDRLADRQRIGNVETMACDVRSFADHLPEPVDVAVIANTFHGIEDPDPVLAAVADVLAPGGRLLVINWRDQPRETTTVADQPRGPPTDLRLSPEETTATVEDAVDLTRTRSVDLPPYHYALVFER